MAHYGQLFDQSYDQNKENVRAMFYAYFENPTLQKLKDIENYSMYVCEIHTGLVKNKRYLMIFVPQDNNQIGTNSEMKKLRWISLQTRELDEYYDVPRHSYKPMRYPPLMEKISLRNRDDQNSSYVCEKLKIQITLLSVKKNNQFEYAPTGTIVTALETFQTIITWI